MKYQVTFSLALLLVACAEQEPQKVTAAAQEQPCEKTYRVGSHIPVHDCDQPKTTDAERQRDYDQMRQTMHPQ